MHHNPSMLVCSYDKTTDFYAYPTDINNYIDMIFPNYSVKINHYAISGRYYSYNTDIMQTWELKGLTLSNKWVMLNSQNEKPLYHSQWFDFPTDFIQIIKGIRIQITGLAYGITATKHNYINTMGGFEIFGEIVNKKYTRMRCISSRQLSFSSTMIIFVLLKW